MTDRQAMNAPAQTAVDENVIDGFIRALAQAVPATASLPVPHDAIAAIIPARRPARAVAARRGIPPHPMRFQGLSKLLGIKIDQLA